MIHACLGTYRLCRLFVISGQHDHFDAHIAKLTDGLCGIFFDHISYSDDPQQLAVARKKQRRFACFRESSLLFGQDWIHLTYRPDETS